MKIAEKNEYLGRIVQVCEPQEVRGTLEGKVSHSCESENTVLQISLTEQLKKEPQCVWRRDIPYILGLCSDPAALPPSSQQDLKDLSCCFLAGLASRQRLS